MIGRPGPLRSIPILRSTANKMRRDERKITADIDRSCLLRYDYRRQVLTAILGLRRLVAARSCGTNRREQANS
jgi:hypothetical protein